MVGAATTSETLGATSVESTVPTSGSLPSVREIWRRPLPLLTGFHRRWIVRTTLSVFRRDLVRAHGLERLTPENDPCIVVLNHSTRLEALFLPMLFAFHRHGLPISFIADWNFALIPGIATILRAGDSILLVRKPAKPAVLNVFKPLFQRKGPAFERAAQRLAQGRSVGIFPEGTTNRHPSALLRGFDGAARLSLTTGRPVLPVGVRFPNHPSGRPIRDRTPMEVFVGHPLNPPEPTPAPTRDQVRDWHACLMGEIGKLSGKHWEADATRRKHHGFE